MVYRVTPQRHAQIELIADDIRAGLKRADIAKRHRTTEWTVTKYRAQVLGKQPRGRPRKCL